MAETKITSNEIQSPGAFVAPAFNTGWGNYDADTEWGGPRYIKLATGLVVIKGLIKNTTAAISAATSTGFILPVGFRPLLKLRFVVSYDGSTAQGSIDIYPTGAVVINPIIPAGGWASLSSISFLAEQ